MRSKKLFGITLCLLLVFVMTGCSTKKASTVQNTNISVNNTSGPAVDNVNANTSPSVQVGTNTAPTAEKIVRIHDQLFDPTPLRISVGTVVTWVNGDSNEHSVKSATFSSGTLLPGDKFSYQFVASGTYDYSCSIHPSMVGQIIVE